MGATYPLSAFSISASGNTKVGDLPPNSRLTFFILLLLAASTTFRPAAPLPVKAILSICMCDANKLPVVPSPVTKLTTPGGKPASLNRRASRRTLYGDFSDALKMNCSDCQTATQSMLAINESNVRTVFPAASAGAIFHDIMISVTFHGPMPAHTPSGSYVVMR